ncbi:hypothetical protein BMS3Abin05_00921 [bacterium BMS3Abin05]|nr:hypothetical protein BMS3Abin05_00921 [bacterium BMS3Abin05]GBE26874.1 hypothetical protein BMS3Bbin03_00794 [bacterium BMS3Bbin03]
MIAGLSFSLSIQGSSILLAGLVIFSIALAVWLYLYTYPPISKGLRIFLGILRTLALLLIVLLIFHPIFHVVRLYLQRPDIAVLVDTSRSMTIKDGRRIRANVEKEVLRQKTFKNLSKRYNLHYYYFSNRAKPFKVSNLDSLNFKWDGTDISQSLLDVRKALLNQYFSGVILISDGIYNVGENPLFLAKNYNVPIYCIGIGDSTEKKDVLIARVLTNRIVYAKNKIPVDVVVTQYGFKGSKVMVVLKRNGKVIDSQPVTLGPSKQEETVRLYFTPLKEGFQKYEVVIPPLKSEFTTLNNRRSFYVKVLKSKLKVLILAGGPSTDVKFIRRILDDDENIDVRVVAQKRYGGFYVIPASARWETERFDAFVMIGFPRWGIRPGLKRFLQAKLLRPKKSLLFIDGDNLRLTDLQFLQPVLPFKIDLTPARLSQVYLELTSAGEQEDILRVTNNMESNINLWQDLPPVDTYLRNFSPLPGTKVLAEINPGRSKLPPNARFKKPLILLRNLDGQKSIALLFENVWRWDLMMWGVGKNDEVLNKFLSRSIRWLSTRVENKPVQLRTDKQIYRSGEEVVFLGQVYDKAFKPVDGADFRVTVRSKKDTVNLLLENAGNGNYQGKFRIQIPGAYTYRGTARLNRLLLGEAKGKFSAGEFQIEFLQTRMNQKLLRELSQSTSGKYYNPDQVSQIEKNIRIPSRELSSETEYNLWNFWFILGLIVLLFTIEWSIRRRKGLL